MVRLIAAMLKANKFNVTKVEESDFPEVEDDSIEIDGRVFIQVSNSESGGRYLVCGYWSDPNTLQHYPERMSIDTIIVDINDALTKAKVENIPDGLK